MTGVGRIGRRIVRAAGIGLAALGVAAAAAAGAAVTASGGEPVDAAGWLARINAAASDGNYRGTIVFTAPGVVSSSRVAHQWAGRDVFERVEALDGHLQRVYRHNDSVHTVWPQRRVVVVEAPAAAPGLVSTRRRVEPRVLDHYALRVVGDGHVAGRPVRQLLLEPRDLWRFAQRLWVDDATGLLLRSDVLAADGHVLESSAFTEVDVGGRADPQALLRDMTPPGFTVARAQREAVDADAQGWRLRDEVPGFRLLGCVRRPTPARAGDVGVEADALQYVYGDGLSYVSLFVEPFRERRHPRALAAELGAMHTVMQRLGDHWVTAMGDVPRPTLERFIRALERSR